MSSLPDMLKVLEEKLEDLQRDTKFCISNYDYHHKNNEYEILEQLQNTLDGSLQDGQKCLSNIKKVRGLISKAQQRCLEADKMLKDLGIDTEVVEEATTATSAATGNCPSSSHSFTEDDRKHCDDLEGNKENENY